MLRYLTSGESHGPQLTTICDGLPAGLPIDLEQLNYQLARRQKGYGRGGRMKIETDRAEIVSGVRHGATLGGPVTLVIKNKDWENWTNIMDPINPIPDELTDRERRLAYETRRPRPGHADLAGGIKWGHHDLRNVLERASARETAARVAVGCLARQFLEQFGVRFASHVVQIGEAALPEDFERPDLTDLNQIAEESPVRCIDPVTEKRMVEQIRAAGKDSDSLGGVAELIVSGLPAGLGGFSQWDHRLEGRLSGALMAIHSAKGVQVGLGFETARRRGSAVHDEIFLDSDRSTPRKGFRRETNNAGGIEGGITNGEDIVIQVAGKPISTLNRPLRTVDVETREEAVAMVERTDVCVTPAFAVVTEAVAALVLAEVFMDKFGRDSVKEIQRNYAAYLRDEY